MHQRSWLAVKPIRKATRRQPRRRCGDVSCHQEKPNKSEKIDVFTSIKIKDNTILKTRKCYRIVNNILSIHKIHRMKKFAFLSILIFNSILIFAQNSSNKDFFKISPLIGLDFGHLKVENSDLGIANEINSLETQNNFGFSLGLKYDFNITNQFSISPQTLISFQSSSLNFDLENQDNREEDVEPVTIEIPIHFTFKKISEKRINPVVFGGLRYIYDISNEEEDDRLDLKKNDFAIDSGAGLEVKLDKYNLRAEFIYTLGLVNLKNSNTDIFNSAINSINRDRISFRIILSK